MLDVERIVIYSQTRNAAAHYLNWIHNHMAIGVVEEYRRVNGDQSLTLIDGTTIRVAMRAGDKVDLLLTDTSNIDPDIIAAVAISGGRIVHIEPLRVEIERIEQACLAAT